MQAVVVILSGALISAQLIRWQREARAKLEPSEGAPAQAVSASYGCAAPVRYRIGAVDARTGLDALKLKSAAADAAAMWESAYGGKLFAYDESGPWAINLSYERWVTMEGMDQANERFELDHQRYDSEFKEYKQLQAAYEPRAKALQNAVQAWNAGGGGSRDRYEAIEREQRELEEMFARLNSMHSQLSGINWADSEESKRVQELAKTNDRLGECDPGARAINLYYASDDADLVRLLAHEMGHALGLRHVPNPDAIMAPRKSKQRELTADDLKALRALCRRP